MNAVTTIEAGERFLRVKQVAQMTGLCKTTIYEMRGRGEFPESHQIGPQTVVWLESDVRTWMAERLEASRKSKAL